MAAKKKAVKATEASAEALDQLASMAPQADSYNRTQFPKLVFKSQTVLDDDENVIIKAGTFFVERPTEEEDEDGKVVWDQEEIGKSFEAHIIYNRKRLQYWDTDASEFYTTPMYDSSDETLPLFKAGEFVTDGTPSELKGQYSEQKEVDDRKNPGEKKMITVSKLRDAKVLYVIYKGEILELTIQGTSMYSFMDYAKKVAFPATITAFNSTKEENGSNKWNKISFKASRNPSGEEATSAIEIGKELLQGIEDEKAFYASKRMQAQTTRTIEGGEATEALPAGGEEGDDDDF